MGFSRRFQAKLSHIEVPSNECGDSGPRPAMQVVAADGLFRSGVNNSRFRPMVCRKRGLMLTAGAELDLLSAAVAVNISARRVGSQLLVVASCTLTLHPRSPAHLPSL